ncbi:hypothetical protein J6590_064680 [Homalodisca vitripennis]|nr:hypothetical protein J6590_064680 [Homalodisca vitripennis]
MRLGVRHLLRIDCKASPTQPNQYLLKMFNVFRERLTVDQKVIKIIKDIPELHIVEDGFLTDRNDISVMVCPRRDDGSQYLYAFRDVCPVGTRMEKKKQLHAFDVAYTLCVPSSCSETDVAVHVGTNLAEINATVIGNVICSTAEPPPFRLKDYFAMHTLTGRMWKCPPTHDHLINSCSHFKTDSNLQSVTYTHHSTVFALKSGATLKRTDTPEKDSNTLLFQPCNSGLTPASTHTGESNYDTPPAGIHLILTNNVLQVVNNVGHPYWPPELNWKIAESHSVIFYFSRNSRSNKHVLQQQEQEQPSVQSVLSRKQLPEPDGHKEFR